MGEGGSVHQAFPKWKFHPHKSAVMVPDADSEKALGPGWYDTPTEATRRLEEEQKKQQELQERQQAEKEEQERQDKERKRLLEVKQLELVERQLAGISVPGNLECSFESRWRRILWQAVIQCGRESNYQRIASWIAENYKQADLPKQYRSPETDLGLLLKHDKGKREQFQKDLNKVKTALRKQS